MTTYIVVRPFANSPGKGKRVEVKDNRRAEILIARGFIAPGDKAPMETEALAVAVRFVPVASLAEFLALVDNTAALQQALEAEVRGAAKPLIEARLAELAPVPDTKSGLNPDKSGNRD